MSTKIYDAYVCPKFRGIEDMNAKVHAVGKEMHKRLLSRFHKKIAEDWQFRLDDELLDHNRTFTNEERFGKYLETIEDVCKKYEAIGATTRRNPEYDFSFKVSMLPYRKNVYMMIFSEHPDLVELFAKALGAKDFHYQNSTDRPEHIPAREWRKRERVWDGILGDNAPVEVGFTYDFSVNKWRDTPLREGEVRAYIPTFKSRAERRATNEIFFREYKKANDSFIAATHYLQSLAGKVEVNTLAGDILRKLTATLDPDPK